MAKDFEELKRRTEKLIDDAFDDDQDAIDLFNSANEELSPAARYAQVKTASYLHNMPIVSLPSGWIEIAEIKIKLDGDSNYRRIYPLNLVQPNDMTDNNDYPHIMGTIGYELFGNEIEIRPSGDKDGELMIRYYGELPSIKTLSDIPSIPSRFHNAYVLFAASKWFEGYQDEHETARNYLGQFYSKKDELDEYMKLQVSKTKSKTVYQFRRWS